MEANSFATSVGAGRVLAQQLRYGGPLDYPTMSPMDGTATQEAFLTCPMVYAVITDMNVFGKADAEYDPYNQHPQTYPMNAPTLPAFVPLTLGKMKVKVECHISTGFVTMKSTWHVNCIRSQASCDCLLALPMDNQGTVSSVEIDMGNDRLYTTTVVPTEEAASYGARGSPDAEVSDPGAYNPKLYRLNIPQVEGGTKLEVKVTWFQSMTFDNGMYSLRVPLVFPQEILPLETQLVSIIKVKCAINTGTNDYVVVGAFGNSMEEAEREPGKVKLKKDGDDWKNQDFIASYKVWSDGIFPNLIYQDGEPEELDSRGSFCLSISPPDPNKIKVFQRAVVFLLDRSGSMYGKPIEDARQALFFALDSLKPEDSFNIVAFDHELTLFSSQMERATPNAIGWAREWAMTNCTARGGTDILGPLQQAFNFLENFPWAVPYVFLITDGAVSDEQNICLAMQSRIAALGVRSPRISTFGIGFYCNFYFLKMLAVIGRGMSDVAFTSDKIRKQMERMLVAAATPVLTNLGLAGLPDGCEVYPFPIADLFCGNPLIVSGKFHGEFPKSIVVTGLLPDQSTWQLEIPSRKDSKFPLNKQLDLLTGQAWLYGDMNRQQEAVNLSLATGLPCQYTRVIGFETTRGQYDEFQNERKQGKKTNINKFTAGKVAAIVLVAGLVIGFGSVAATLANSAVEETAEEAAGGLLEEGGGEVAEEDCCCGDLCGSLFSCISELLDF